MDKQDTPWPELLAKVRATDEAAALDELELSVFGRKQGLLTQALKQLGTMTPEERKTRGQELNDWKQKLEEAFAERRGSLQSSTFSQLGDTDRLDPTLELPEKEEGHLHLIPQFIRTVEDLFGTMGFDVARGPEVESDDYNFTYLNIPPNHPARDMQATFWVADDGKPKVLRTHTSPVQIHYMRSHKPPFRMICPGKVYRNDYDATHSPMFHQFEGLMIGKDLSLAHMKAVMVKAMKTLISPDIEFRFRTAYFQFVEPGLEVDMRWRSEGGHGKEGKWLEVVGCGMVHPNVLRHGGIDPEEYRGFAFGFGIERLLMIKHQVPDLRSFYEGDLRFLRQF